MCRTERKGTHADGLKKKLEATIEPCHAPGSSGRDRVCHHGLDIRMPSVPDRKAPEGVQRYSAKVAYHILKVGYPSRLGQRALFALALPPEWYWLHDGSAIR